VVKQAYRWSMILHPRPDPVTEKMEKAFYRGSEVHKAIQARFIGWDIEKTGTFSHPDLPCDIIYHADLWHRWSKCVVDIKPMSWGLGNIEYCSIQLSGYSYFLKAKSVHLMFYNWYDWPEGIPITGFERVIPTEWEDIVKRVEKGYSVLKDEFSL